MSELTILPKYTYSGDLIWTIKEEQRLMHSYIGCSKQELLLLFPDRTWIAIRHKARRLKIKKIYRWSNEEESLLRKLSKNTKDFSLLSKFFLHRTSEAIRTKYYRHIRR